MRKYIKILSGVMVVLAISTIYYFIYKLNYHPIPPIMTSEQLSKAMTGPGWTNGYGKQFVSQSAQCHAVDVSSIGAGKYDCVLFFKDFTTYVHATVAADGSWKAEPYVNTTFFPTSN